ncbi:type II toxin-antitoxin system PrlF family antitoxin [Patescibacteria group bacterium]|nr:type II toxin-antitoxin system PrlF family antitoxin [Patescibacteria group bacterium]MBU1123245.1 type II toxin-antitoxin system PrlF family antitoxin [Patescibacteria group bacterium]MBU1911616.1 type II toxin-antitoxin system PrlF family antitoxin [Patescibacteria group bacterium]
MPRSRLTKKGQATIPAEIRAFLDVDSGDMISFSVEDDSVVISKMNEAEDEYLRSVESSLASEWLSQEDSNAYDDL